MRHPGGLMQSVCDVNAKAWFQDAGIPGEFSADTQEAVADILAEALPGDWGVLVVQYPWQHSCASARTAPPGAVSEFSLKRQCVFLRLSGGSEDMVGLLASFVCSLYMTESLPTAAGWTASTAAVAFVRRIRLLNADEVSMLGAFRRATNGRMHDSPVGLDQLMSEWDGTRTDARRTLARLEARNVIESAVTDNENAPEAWTVAF